MNLEIRQIIPDSDPKDFSKSVSLVESKLGKPIDSEQYANEHTNNEVILCAKDEQARVLAMIAIEFAQQDRSLRLTAGAVSVENGEEEANSVMGSLFSKAKSIGKLVGRESIVVNTYDVSKIEEFLADNGFEQSSPNVLVSSVE